MTKGAVVAVVAAASLLMAAPIGTSASTPRLVVPSRPQAIIKPSATVRRVVLLGDSLAQEVSPFIRYLVPGKPLVPKFWGGTAPCDWVGVDLTATRSSVVVITFTGNSLTPCMRDADGTQLRGDALIDRYRSDITTLVATSRRAGARVVLVGQPYRAASFDADREVDGINEIYRSLAASNLYVSFVDAGAAVEDGNGAFAERLPCLPFDPDCAEDGTTVVRGDGVHFCPIVGENPCSVWSSGAFRFGAAIAAAVRNPRRFD